MYLVELGRFDMNEMNREKPAAGSAGRRRLTYRDHQITIIDRPQPATPRLSIDGTEVMLVREETGTYSAPMLNMFATYPTVEELARSLVDLSPVFLAKGKQ